MIGADTAPPTEAPALKMPTASARSLTGNHSLAALIAPGQLPASPKPSTARHTRNDPADLENACMMAANDHTTIDKTKPIRVPITS